MGNDNIKYSLITYTCGHTEKAVCPEGIEPQNLKPPVICPKCRSKKSETPQNSIPAIIKELYSDMPEIKGTEKQLPYATATRKSFIDIWSKTGTVEDMERVKTIVKNERDAGFWMDNRKIIKTREFLIEYTPTKPKEKKKAQMVYEIRAEEKVKFDAAKQKILEKNTLKPSQFGKIETYEEVFEIVLKDEKYLELRNVKETNDVLNKIIEDNVLSFNGIAWSRLLTEFTGNFTDRAAQLGIALISAGYSVIIKNSNIKTMIKTGHYVKENDRWIKMYNNSLIFLDWKGYNYELANEALKSIKGAYWDKSYNKVFVPVTSYRGLMHFAKSNNFSYQYKVLSMIERTKRKSENAVMDPLFKDQTTMPRIKI